MNQRVSTILTVALLISAAATFVVYRLVVARASQAAMAPTTQVIEAARTLEIGTLIREVDLKTGSWTGTIPAGMATRKESLVGRGVVAPIYEGEAIMENRVAAAGAGGGLAATIPPGMRACAVRVNEIVGVAGFVVPGMRVDVLISGNPPGQSSAGAEVKTLLQNIEVLSAGQNYQKEAEGKPTLVTVVNLLVNPEQAQILSLASNETRIQLVLRNPLDTEQTQIPGVAMASLFGTAKPAAAPAPPRAKPVVAVVKEQAPVLPPPAPPAPFLVQVINGPRATEAKFPRAEEEKQ